MAQLVACENGKPRLIKTYTRLSKTKDELISFLNCGELPVEYEGACRLCLEVSENMIQIFNDNDSIIPMKIRSILNIEVDENDQMPSLICGACLSLLNETYTFKKRSIANDVKLRQYLCKPTAPSIKPYQQESAYDTFEESNQLFSVEKEECTVEWDDKAPLVGVLQSLPNLVSTQPFTSTNQAINHQQLTPSQSPSQLVDLTQVQEHQNTDNFTLPDHNYDGYRDDVNHSQKVTSVHHLAERPRNFSLQQKKKTDLEDDAPLADRINEKKNENGGSIFSCIKCRRRFATRIELNDHRTSCILKELCTMCPKSFVSRSLLMRHMRIHTGEKPFECEFCLSTFSQKEIMYRHIAQIHATFKPYKCKLCPKSFAIPSLLANHLRSSHDSTRKYACHLCGREFNHCSGLSRHRSTHNDIFFQCKICKKKFNDFSSVKRHIKFCHTSILVHRTSKAASHSQSEKKDNPDISNEQNIEEEEISDLESSSTNAIIKQYVLKTSVHCSGLPTKNRKISNIKKKLSGKMKKVSSKRLLDERKESVVAKRPRGRPRKIIADQVDNSNEKCNDSSEKHIVKQQTNESMDGNAIKTSGTPDGSQTTEKEVVFLKAIPGRPKRQGRPKKIFSEAIVTKLKKVHEPPSKKDSHEKSGAVFRKPRGRPRKSSTIPTPEESQQQNDEPENKKVSVEKKAEKISSTSTPPPSSVVVKRPRGRPRKSSIEAVTPSKIAKTSLNLKETVTSTSKTDLHSETSEHTNQEPPQSTSPTHQEYETLLAESQETSLAVKKSIESLKSSLISKITEETTYNVSTQEIDKNERELQQESNASPNSEKIDSPESLTPQELQLDSSNEASNNTKTPKVSPKVTSLDGSKTMPKDMPETSNSLEPQSTECSTSQDTPSSTKSNLQEKVENIEDMLEKMHSDV